MMLKKGLKVIQDFTKLEAFGGMLLVFTAALAMMIANSPWQQHYHHWWHVYLGGSLFGVSFKLSLLHWINDGLMALFFLLVGLEIKHEVLRDGVRGLAGMRLSVIAAIGGMVVPGLVYAAFTWHNPQALRGWAIPTATDIAFALGVLAILGKRVPSALKLFLTSLAIMDDLGAILIIAFFYTASINSAALVVAGVSFLLLILCNRAGIKSLAIYGVLGFILWAAVLKSGVHATIAGVLLALTIPSSKSQPDGIASPLQRLEHRLQPWVVYVILPIFAFANAGVSLGNLSVDVLWQPVTLGIILGLFVGKQVGVMLFSVIGVALKAAKLPDNCTWWHIYGASLLCGIGFTMSLFIGMLAFRGNAYFDSMVRIGVIVASLLCGGIGYLVLRWRLNCVGDK